ncbi:MAG: helix-turn-helix domain-containing protein [Candidatus Saccharibacteria bacterium]|nr:helix-turn-helix domain-containing protein [Candidatus Saccharibacteria bacterium]
MSYSTNPSLEKARGKAMKLLFIDELSVQMVADRFGVSRTTIWRWKRKWLALNSHIALENQMYEIGSDVAQKPSGSTCARN